MGYTIAEKILARTSGGEAVRAGDFVLATPDYVMANDCTAPVAINGLNELGVTQLQRPERVAFVLSHFAPAVDITSAKQLKKTRDFVRSDLGKDINFFDAGSGIEHVLLPELGLALPGDLVIGADSHTCTYGGIGAFATGVGSTDVAGILAFGKIWMRVPETIKVNYTGTLPPHIGGKDLILALLRRTNVDGALYKAIEFHGQPVADVGVEGRLTMANMAVEGGAKAGFCPPDDATLEYCNARAQRDFTPQTPDVDAVYCDQIDIDVSDLRPQIAKPPEPANVGDIDEVLGIKLDQVYIGSCTNSRITDLRVVAEIVKGRTVAPGIQAIVVPGSQNVWKQAQKEGLIEIFADAGFTIGPPTCGACFGGHMGVVGPDEVCLSTTNRNFRGRMGDPSADVYLSNPAVAAASALTGRITDPADIDQKATLS